MKILSRVSLTCLLFCLWVSPVYAGEHKWERKLLGDYVSMQNEPLPDFLLRTGLVLQEFTVETGFEACGAIASADGKYSVRLYTDGVPQGCSMNRDEVIDGYAYTGETIHSHPWKKLLTITAAARDWSKFYDNGQASGSTLRNDGAGGFSRADKKVGGWLVANHQLMHLEDGKTVVYGEVTTGK